MKFCKPYRFCSVRPGETETQLEIRFYFKKVRHRLQLEFKIDAWTRKPLCLCPLVTLISQIRTNGKPDKFVDVAAAADRCFRRVLVVRQPLLSAGEFLFWLFFFHFLSKFSSHQSVGLLKFQWCVV